jgi:hypothetical protein
VSIPAVLEYFPDATAKPETAVTDPEPYLLRDQPNEEKLGFSVAESIARSKELHRTQGGLFAGKLFHLVSSCLSAGTLNVATDPVSA